MMATNATPGSKPRQTQGDGLGPVETMFARAKRCLANGYFPVPALRHDAPAFVERNGRQEPNSPGKRPHGGLWNAKERAVYGATPDSIVRWARIAGIADGSSRDPGC